MDSFEFTKILGALLAAGIVVSLSGFISELFYPEPEPPARAGAVTPSEASAAPGATPAAESGTTDIVALLAVAAPEAGRKVFKKCVACHSADKGGRHKIGPNLWDVVDRPIASAEGFTYSGALAAMPGEAWSYENLDAFLEKPRDWAPGTRMGFAGLKKPKQRAAVIAYLRSLSDNPAALPE